MAYLALHTAQHGNNSLLGAGNKLSTAPTALLTPAIKVCSTRTAYTYAQRKHNYMEGKQQLLQLIIQWRVANRLVRELSHPHMGAHKCLLM
jgi:hypothetical protein